MTTLNSIGLVIAGLVIGYAASLALTGGGYGGTYNLTEQYFPDIEVSNTALIGGDATVSGGTLTLTHTNTATSTAIIGCWQSYATSTATPVRMEFSTTTALATFSGGIVPNGVVAWRYGTCPLL